MQRTRSLLLLSLFSTFAITISSGAFITFAEPEPFTCDTEDGYTNFEKDYAGVDQVCPAHDSNYSTIGREPSGPLYIVIHNTDGFKTQDAIDLFQSQGQGASAHYIVGPDSEGDIRVVQMVREKHNAWHADANRRELYHRVIDSTNSVGIEVVGRGEASGWPSDEIYNKVAALVKDIVKRAKTGGREIYLERDYIVGHEEVNRAGKWDPGPNWNWKRFMEEFLGAIDSPRAMYLGAYYNPAKNEVELALIARANGRDGFKLERIKDGKERKMLNPIINDSDWEDTFNKNLCDYSPKNKILRLSLHLALCSDGNPATISFKDIPPTDGTIYCYRAWAYIDSKRDARDVKANYVNPSNEVCISPLFRNINAALVLDRSGSMSSANKLPLAKSAAKLFVDLSRPGDQLTVSAFSSTGYLISPLTTILSDEPDHPAKQTIKNAIDALTAGGMTNFGAGLQIALDQLKSAAISQTTCGILMSNGMHNTGSYTSQVQEFQALGWPIYTVSFGTTVNKATLRQIATDTGGLFFDAEELGFLLPLFARIQADCRGSSLISFLLGLINQGLILIQDLPPLDPITTLVKFLLSWGGSDLDLVLIKPDGTEIGPGEAAADPDITYVATSTYEFYTVKNPDAGQWRMKIIGADVPGPDPEKFITATIIEDPSPVSANFLGFQSRYNVGDLVDIGVILREGGNPITGASVTGTVTKPDGTSQTLTLFDDGAHNDNAAGDGIYGNTFTDTDLEGLYTIEATASGSFTRKLKHQIQVGDITAAQADLSVTKTDNPDPVVKEQNLTYTLTIVNNGPDNASGVTLTDTLPPGVTFISATPQGICTEAGGTVTCNLGLLANGGEAIVTITVTVDANAPDTLNNTATVAGNETDPDGSNNTATTVTDVYELPPIARAKAGARNFIIQSFFIRDRGDQPHPTDLEQICVTKTGASTLPDRYIRQIKLFHDRGTIGMLEPGTDALLGISRRPTLNPDVELQGTCFGREGRLLYSIPNGATEYFLLAVDFGFDAPDLLTLQTMVVLKAGESLEGGSDVGDDFEAGGEFDVGPMITIDNTAMSDTGAQVVPEPNDAEVELGGTRAIIGQFQIEDYGSDGYPTLVEHVTLLLSGRRGAEPDLSILEGIRSIYIYKESGDTPPGLQRGDRVIGRLPKPTQLGELVTLNDEEQLLLTFGRRGRTLLHIPDGGTERIYVVAELSQDFQNGDEIYLEVIIGARDLGGQYSSAFDIAPGEAIPAYNPVILTIPPPSIVIPETTISSSGKLIVSMENIPAPGLSSLMATFTYDPLVADVALNPLGEPKVRALGNYEVTAANLGATGLDVIVTLRPGRKAATGDFELLEMEFEALGEMGEETKVKVDPWTLAAKDTADKDIILDVDPGKIEIRLIKGDVDFDGIVTRRDAREVALFIVGRSSLSWTELRQKAADVVGPFCGTYPSSPTRAPACIDASDVRAIMLAAYGVVTLELQPLQVEAVTLSQNSNGFTFKVKGQGVASTQLQVYNLAGQEVFDSGQVEGATFEWNLMNNQGEIVANGVYLYIVTITGYDGQVIKSEVRKLVILR